MGPTEHDPAETPEQPQQLQQPRQSQQPTSPRERADQLAAALVMLGHTPRRCADPEEDCRAQQATLLAAAAQPYVASAADPAVCGQPPVFAEAVQTVHGRPKDPHQPVHDHLITHLGVAAQYLHALFGRVPGGQEQPETLRTLFSFSMAMLGGAAGVHDRVRSAHMGITREEEGQPMRVSYVFDATDLAQLARHVADTAQEFITHLDFVAPEASPDAPPPGAGPGRPGGPGGSAGPAAEGV